MKRKRVSKHTLEIYREYQKVLAYKKLSFEVQTQNEILNKIEKVGAIIKPAKSDIQMVDESDRIFYDTAKAGGAALVTGNVKHYPKESFIMTPAEFLEMMGTKYGI